MIVCWQFSEHGTCVWILYCSSKGSGYIFSCICETHTLFCCCCCCNEYIILSIKNGNEYKRMPLYCLRWFCIFCLFCLVFSCSPYLSLLDWMWNVISGTFSVRWNLNDWYSGNGKCSGSTPFFFTLLMSFWDEKRKENHFNRTILKRFQKILHVDFRFAVTSCCWQRSCCLHLIWKKHAWHTHIRDERIP